MQESGRDFDDVLAEAQVGEIWGRYGGDMAEIWGRYRAVIFDDVLAESQV